MNITRSLFVQTDHTTLQYTVYHSVRLYCLSLSTLSLNIHSFSTPLLVSRALFCPPIAIIQSRFPFKSLSLAVRISKLFIEIFVNNRQIYYSTLLSVLQLSCFQTNKAACIVVSCLFYIHQGGYVFVSVCLFVYQQSGVKSYGQIITKFSQQVPNGTMTVGLAEVCALWVPILVCR